MEREELKGNQTPGEWSVEAHDVYDKSFMCGPAQIDNDDVDHKEAEANGALIAEAGTVANRTGMWPLDMEQRIKALEEFVSRVAYDPIGPATASAESILNTLVQEARAILNKRNQP